MQEHNQVTEVRDGNLELGKRLCISIATEASLIAQLVKNPPAMQETLVRFLGWEDPWRRDKLPTPVFLDFLGGSAGKESTCNAADRGLIPGLGRSPGEGKGYPLQHSDLENSRTCQILIPSCIKGRSASIIFMRKCIS